LHVWQDGTNIAQLALLPEVPTMSRTPLFEQIARSIRTALHLEERGLETREGLEMLREEARVSRRRFLGTAAAVGAAAALPGCAMDVGVDGEELVAARGDVGIVGAGLAGLACARELLRYGLVATVHEGGDRLGGRVWSMGGAYRGPVTFPGQVVERGGELIDTTHTTMRGYAREFGLTLENYIRQPGDVSYYFGGQSYDEAAIVDEFRAFVPALQADLRALGAPTADSFTAADEALDRTTLAAYLDSRGAGPLIKKALDVAYTIEYGLEIDRQSCLNLLLFIHADRRSRFQPFGVFSDEKYHVAEGNQAIVDGLAARLRGPVHLGRVLVRAAKRSDGRVELTFREGRRTIVAVHDAVVFAVPFSTLRDVELNASLGLPSWKRFAIDSLGYGTNAKMMIGFAGRPWRTYGSNGSSYSDLPNHQSTWETNPSAATASRGVLTDFSGGLRGAALRTSRVQREASAFLADLDRIWPGAAAAAARSGGNVLAHLEHWPSNPLFKGSYTCNGPGYFTTIADNEAKPVGNLFFAGEHTSSFYEWQGFMEGAALSGLRAAAEVGDFLRADRRTARLSRRGLAASMA
jgi:monoamine oxidase